VSGHVVSRYILGCDGCGAERPEESTSMEARAAAYADGWRFPSKVTAHGTQSSNTSDVCPKCLPDWEPRPSRRRGGPKPREAS
jgi:hypothetical protein